MDGMPSRGGPPGSILERSTDLLLKSVWGQADFQSGENGWAAATDGKSNTAARIVPILGIVGWDVLVVASISFCPLFGEGRDSPLRFQPRGIAFASRAVVTSALERRCTGVAVTLSCAVVRFRSHA